MPDTRLPGESKQLFNDQIAQVTADESERVGLAETITGLVEVLHVDGTRENLTAGGAIFAGDIIETSNNGNVGIIFEDESVMSMGPGGHLTMDELVYDPDGPGGNMIVSIAEGVFSYISGTIAKTDPNAMVINTPTSSIGIRGTQVVGNIRPIGEENTITLMAEQDGSVGEVVVRNAGGVQILNQEGATVSLFNFSDPPPPPRFIPRDQLIEQFRPAFDALPPRFHPDRPPPPRREDGNREDAPDQDAAQTADGTAAGNGDGNGDGNGAEDGLAAEGSDTDDDSVEEELATATDVATEDATDTAESVVQDAELAETLTAAAEATIAGDESAFADAMEETDVFGGDDDAVAAAEDAFSEALEDGASIDEAMEAAFDAGDSIVAEDEATVAEISFAEAIQEVGAFGGDSEATTAAEEAFNDALADGASVDDATQAAFEAGTAVVTAVDGTVTEVSFADVIQVVDEFSGNEEATTAAEEAFTEALVDGASVDVATQAAFEAGTAVASGVDEENTEISFADAIQVAGVFDGNEEAATVAEVIFTDALASGATIDEATQAALNVGLTVAAGGVETIDDGSLENGFGPVSMTPSLNSETDNLFAPVGASSLFGSAENPEVALVPPPQQPGFGFGLGSPPPPAPVPRLIQQPNVASVTDNGITNDNNATVGVSGSTTVVSGILTGTAGDDTLAGGSEDNTITGGAGNDSLSGGAGDDTYVFASGFGTDVITDASGTDTLSFNSALVGDFGPGSTASEFKALIDLSVSRSTNDLVIDFGSGSTVTVTDQFNLKPIENLTDGTDTFEIASGVAGGTANDLLVGTTGADTIAGAVGNDALFGGDGVDTLTGDAGDDLLNGGDGNDDLQGGVGDDALIGGANNDTLDGGTGNDELFGDSGIDTLTGGTNNDIFYFESNATTGAAIAQVESVTLGGTFEVGDTYSVTIDGTLISHTVVAGDTDIDGIRDSLLAAVNANGTVNPIVTASAGGAGELQLTADNAGLAFTLTQSATNGGATADNTVTAATVTSNKISGANDVDTITDFTRGEDKIELDGTTFSIASVDFERIASTYDGTNATSATANVIVDSNDDLYVDTNGQSSGGYTLVANIQNGAAIDATDIDVV